jgi:hypothetical protein
VIALPHNPIRNARGELSRSGFGNTFYPNAADFKNAKTVNVSASGPARADIVLAPTPLWTVTGTVVGSDGQPAAAGGRLGVTHGDHLFGLDSRSVPIQSGGQFGLAALPPGTYFLLFHEGPPRPARGAAFQVSEAKVVVAGADVKDVRVVPVHLVAVSGRARINDALRPSDRSRRGPRRDGPRSRDRSAMTAGTSLISSTRRVSPS